MSDKPTAEAMRTVAWGVAAVLFALLFRATVAQSYHVPSESMEATLLVGDHMIVEKLSPHFGQIERGEIVVFENPFEPHGADLVKRVVGLPGETIQVVDGHAVIDGKPLDEPYARLDPAVPSLRDFGPVKVPTDSYFMMGDNRDHSYDSRGWGFLPKDRMIGRALFIHWSWKDDGWDVRWDRLGATLG